MPSAAGAGRIVTFGRHAGADWRLDELSPRGRSTARSRRSVPARRISLPPRHARRAWVLNSLARAGGGRGAGRRRRAGGRLRWPTCAPPAGRGERRRIAVAGRAMPLLIDESYNANPASMRAALAVLGQRARPADRRARRHAGAGRTPRPSCMPALAEPVERGRRSTWCFTCGPRMARLHDALPASWRGGHARRLGGPRARWSLDALRAGRRACWSRARSAAGWR